MALFKISSSRALSRPDLAEFIVQFKQGKLAIGDTFTCYDTHHPVQYKVVEVIGRGEKTHLLCSGALGFENQFTGALIDTAAIGRPAGFHYTD